MLWDVLRWPLIEFCAVLLFFGLVYWLAPNTTPRRLEMATPGSILAGVSWLALSGCFALWATFSGSYSKTYGTLASGGHPLALAQLQLRAILLGAELNAELDPRRTSTRRAARTQGSSSPPAAAGVATEKVAGGACFVASDR